MDDLTTMPGGDLEALRVAVAAELNRRQVLATAPQLANQIAFDWSQAAGRVDGEPWVQPVGAFDAYPLPSTVTHDGKTWENLTPANVWPPSGVGSAGWREVVAGGGLAEWVQPTGASDAYSFGDRVTFEGHIWRSVNPGDHTNTWSPTAYPAAWVDEGPVTP